ncbi:hypothetical protein H4Q26_000628 [Puccinia striiformis f. sp. tritici PST-130]|nr:hypothetical protein H4Q26_000628 [Puccinia striiformis f. sp. tritici PST-130]
MPDREREDQEEVDGGDPDTDEEEQSREPSPAEGVESLPINCFVCDSSFATYGPLGCQHRTLCKRCAMKQATGGKCKKCGEMFFQLKIWPPDNSTLHAHIHYAQTLCYI